MKQNCIKSDFKDIILKLATNDRSDKMFLLTSKLRPQGVVSPCPGPIYMYKIMTKNCIRSDFKEIFLKLVANDRSDNRYLLTSKFCPLRLSAPDLQLYTFINHEKMCIKSEVEDILFKLATTYHNDEAFQLTSKFWP